MTDIQDKKESYRLERMSPFGQYEYVNVEFGEESLPLVIRYKRLRPENVDDVRWLDVTMNASQPYLGIGAPIYRERGGGVNGDQWGPGFIILRCDQGFYKTRLLLFVERTEADDA